MAHAASRNDNGSSSANGKPLQVQLPLASFLMRAAKTAREEQTKKPRALRAYPVTSQMDYTAAETEWLMAIDSYKREQCKSFLTNTEMLAILIKRLGYGKIREED